MDSEMESLLRTYRKANRTNDVTGAVTALRRLSEIDNSRDWTPDLVSAERSAQRRLVEKFKAAQVSGRIGESERFARELVDTAWHDAPTGHEMDEVRNFVSVQAAKQNAAKGGELMAVLRKCRDSEWNRDLAFSTLKEIDRLTVAGWSIPQDDKQVADDCRRRCEEELAAEENEKKWRELCERLHGAIQREEVASIRQIMSAPEFLDREPDPELIRAAQLVVRHAEDAKRRKMIMVAGVSLCALLAAIGMSGWWLKQKRFDERCTREANRLAALEKGPHAIERMGKVLRILKSESPDVFDDSRVNIFTERLRTLVEKNIARTNEISATISALRDMQAGGWTVDRDSANGMLSRTKALLTDEDVDLTAEWRQIKKSWNDHLAAEEESIRSAGTEKAEKIISIAQALSTRFAEEIHDEADDGEIKRCLAAIKAWRADYATALPDMDGKIASAEKRMLAALQMHKHLHNAIAKLNDSATIAEMIAARKVLTENYAAYKEVKDLEPLPVSANDLQNVIDATTVEQTAFAAMFKRKIDGESFKTFLSENVLIVADIPTMYSLYGLTLRDDSKKKIIAIAKGNVNAKESTGYGYHVRGDMLDLEKRKMVDDVFCKYPYRIDILPSTEEMRDIVETAERANITAGQFERELLKLIDRHLKDEHKDSLAKMPEKSETDEALTRDRYPAYRRIQMLDIYFRWLGDDLKLIPDVPELTEWTRKVAALAAPIKVDGIHDDLSWACRWEPRVRRRDVECARLLAQIPQTWTSTCKSINSEMQTLRSVSRWRVQTAGIVRFNPTSPDLSTVSPGVFPSVACDHPLYVMRTENGKLKLKQAFVPQGGRWVQTSMARQNYVSGEPILQVIEDAKPIDPEARLSAMADELKTPAVRRMLANVPLFSPKIDLKSTAGR